MHSAHSMHSDSAVSSQGSPSQSQETGGASRSLNFEFTGTGGEFFRIWIVNILLTVATLGIYSAWAKVRTKNYFYRNTRVDGSTFEYHADPLKILKGRLIVGGVLAVVFAAQHYSLTLYGVMVMLLSLVTPAIVVLSLAFNARNSSYRNVRFSFQGSIAEGFRTYFVAGFVYLVTLGIGMPYMQWRLTQFVARNHQYGLERFGWSVRVGEFFKVYLMALLYMVPGVLAFGVAILGARGDGSEGAGAVIIGAGAIGLYACMFLAFAFIRARLANLIYGGLRIGSHSFNSNQEAFPLIGIYLSNFLMVALTLGLYTPWAKVRLAQYRAEHLNVLAVGELVAENAPQGEGGVLGDAATDLGDFDLDLGF